MNKQTKLAKEETDITKRIYINYTKYSVQTRLTEGKVLVFDKTNEEKPFTQQIPKETLTIEQFKQKYGIDLKKQKEW